MEHPKTTGIRTVLTALLERWKRVGKKIGAFQATLILNLFYFLVLGPFALIVGRLDPLAIKAGAARGWLPRVESESDPVERASRQF